MKKVYTAPKLETTKINSKESTAAFVKGNYNSGVLNPGNSSVTNVINY